MAKVQLEVEIKGNDSVGKAAEKTKSLKTQLKELKQELASGSLSGKAFDDMAKQAGKLQEQLDDVNQQVKSLANNSGEIALNGFMSLAEGITGGFAAAQGAMALFGDENEDLQKSLIKVQGAVALLNGVEAINNTLKKEGGLLTAANTIKTNILTFAQMRYAAAVGTTTGAMKIMRIVGLAIPIVALITGITLLIANFDKVKNVVMKLLGPLGTLAKYIGGLVEQFTDFIGITSESERAFEKNEAASNALIKSYDEQIAILEAMGGQEEKLYKIRLAKLNQDRLILMQKKMLNLASTEEIEKIDELATAIKVLKITEENRLKDVGKKQDEANQKAAEKRKADNQKRFDEVTKEALDRLKQFEDELKAKQEIEDQYNERKEEKELDAQKKYGELIEQRRIDDLSLREKELFDIEEKYRLQQEAAMNNAFILAEIENDKNKELADKKKQYAKEDAEIQKEIDLTRIDAIAMTANQASQLLTQVAGKNKSLAMTALAVEKGAAIADVIIKGIRERAAISLRYAGNLPAATPELIASKIRTGLSVATITATGIQGAKSIGNTSSGGGGTPNTQAPNIRGASTNFEPRPQQAPIKVFVAETDIRNTTRKVDGIYSQATIK